MDKVKAQRISEKIQAILKKELPDCEIKVLGGKFTSVECTYKLQVTPHVDGQVVSKDAEDFKRLATYYGLQPTDLGREIDYNGQKMKITGLRPSKRRFPIIALEVSTGKQFFLIANSVVNAIRI